MSLAFVAKLAELTQRVEKLEAELRKLKPQGLPALEIPRLAPKRDTITLPKRS